MEKGRIKRQEARDSMEDGGGMKQDFKTQHWKGRNVDENKKRKEIWGRKHGNRKQEDTK